MVLTTLDGDLAIAEARRLIGQAQGSRDIINLVSTIVLYKFNNLSRDEVDLMLGIELQQTRVYREAMAEGEVLGLERGKAEGRTEGKAEGERALVLKLLNRRLGKISIKLQTRVGGLSLEKVELLGEALLDFTDVADLERFLDS
jgi:predicted transposase YdaD